ncbi:zinc metalloprotease HtpX [candidate division KSB1 bacterium]|nr:zinc metalloprotease HtpX [candidate division KSB1 bacterium]
MTNNIRTLFFMSLLTVLFVWIGGALAGKQGALIAFIAAAVMNFWGYWFSDKMVLSRYKAAKVGPENNPRLYGIVSTLAANANLPMPKVYVIPENTPNAFATGRDPKHAAVVATEGIIRLLDDNELAGVMAHELTHVKNRDILTSTIAATFAGAIAMMAQFARFSGGTRTRQNPVMLIFVIIGAPLAAVLIRMLVSRIREYAADAGGAKISGQPLALANALNKLHYGVQKYPLTNGNPAHSHMFIINPFFGGMQKLFATHPPIDERIKRLEAMANSGTTI